MSADADLAGVLARLQRLEDLEAVRAAWLDYCTQIDLGDMGRLGDVFTEDAVLEMDGLARSVDRTYTGRREIIDEFYEATLSPSGPPGSTTAMTGHLSTNMQIELDGDEATTLAYFFEIVDDNLVLIGTYQHRMRRDPDRWRFSFLRIAVRYRARLEAGSVRGQPLTGIVERPVGGAPGIGSARPASADLTAADVDVDSDELDGPGADTDVAGPPAPLGASPRRAPTVAR